MKARKVMAVATATVMTLSLAACGGSSASSGESTQTKPAESKVEYDKNGPDGNYANIVLGETGTDISAKLKLLTHRTDMLATDYPGTNYQSYIDEFHKMYPNIEIDIEGITNYAEDALLRLQGGEWGDIMMIPAIDAEEFGNYFMPYGDLETMEGQIRFASAKQYHGTVYGIPSTGAAQGVLYNKAVFEKAGITELPKTPEDFIADLKLIKEKTDAIPLYTNYAAGWTMGAWDAYIGGTATGDSEYTNRKMLHTANPFSDPGDGSHAYNIYKVLYEAVAEGLTEDDYSTTDWEGSKGMMNRGEIGTMVLGSWAYSQMQAAGDKPEDIGYMSFPITVGGKQYASAGADYAFGINKDSSDENRMAALIFVKWMTEKSGFSYNEGGIPICASDNKYPELYAAFDGIDYVFDDPAVEGEEGLLDLLNADSELNLNNGGDKKIQEIVEHASNGDMTFDAIMEKWNAAWTEAQELNNVEITK